MINKTYELNELILKLMKEKIEQLETENSYLRVDLNRLKTSDPFTEEEYENIRKEKEKK